MRTNTASNVNNGFTYIGLLLFIAITGVGLSVAGMSWQYKVRAEKEKQLLFVGAEFRNAINSYYASSPDAAKVYPATLNDLLLDKRMPNIKRHLRKIYLDPMTGKADWRVVSQQGRIVGIYSRSSLVPYKQNGFNRAEASFVGARFYKDWIFVSGGVENKSQSPSLSAHPNSSNQNQISAKDESSSATALINLDPQSSQANITLPTSTESFKNSEEQPSRIQSNIVDFYTKDGVLRYGVVPKK